MGVRLPQAKKCQEPLDSERRKEVPVRDFRGNVGPLTPWFIFWRDKAHGNLLWHYWETNRSPTQCSCKSILCASAGTIRPIPCLSLMFFLKIKTRLFPTWLLFLDLYSRPPVTLEYKFCSRLSALLNSGSLLGISLPTSLPHTIAHLSWPRPGITSSVWTLLCQIMSYILFSFTATVCLHPFIHLHSLYFFGRVPNT